MMPPASSEANVVRTYIDWVMKTPWYQETEDTQDINEVERILLKKTTQRTHWDLP